jgi:hypothetical protein
MDVLDAAGRRRSPATLPAYHRRRPPRIKGLRYPSDVLARALVGAATALLIWAPPIRRRLDRAADNAGHWLDSTLARVAQS